MTNTTRRVAHRGGSLLAPENTLAAFRTALTLPVDAVEFDVQMSRDGQPVIFHDNTVERLTDGTGNVLDLDFSYLRTLNAASHFPGGWSQSESIPTLHEVLSLFKGRRQLQIELKSAQRADRYSRYPHIAETVVAELQASAMVEQALVISFDWDLLKVVKELDPQIQTGLIVSKSWWLTQNQEPFRLVCQQATTLECAWIGLDYHLFAADMPGYAEQHGLQLGLWTVNSLEDLRTFSKMGVHTLTSDRPDLFVQLSGTP